MFSKLKNVRKSINSRTDVVEYWIHNLDHQNFFRIVSVKPTLSTLFPLILFWIFLQNTYQFQTYWIIYLFTIVLIYSVHTHAQLELSSANIRIFVLLTGITQIKKCLQHSRYSINICLIALNESTWEKRTVCFESFWIWKHPYFALEKECLLGWMWFMYHFFSFQNPKLSSVFLAFNQTSPTSICTLSLSSPASLAPAFSSTTPTLHSNSTPPLPSQGPSLSPIHNFLFSTTRNLVSLSFFFYCILPY